ncbi:RNA recognition motif-containing protein [Lecanora helva]
MSRLKRQRLNTGGEDCVTASSDESDEFRQEQTTVSRSLFVYSLPASATTESLTAFFSQSFPLRHATVVVDTVTKTSKGYGFVTFGDSEDAQRARETLNQSLFDGRRIGIEPAEPRHRQGVKYNPPDAIKTISTAKRQKLKSQQSPKLIVRNLSWNIKDSDQLAALFQTYGKVKHATVPRKSSGLSAGFGFVVFRGRKNAEIALEMMNGKEIEGRTLAVDWAVEKDIWENQHDPQNESRTEQQMASEIIEHQEDRGVKLGTNDDSITTESLETCVSWDEEGKTFLQKDKSLEGGAPFKGLQNNSSTLFLRNLPFSCTDEDLRHHFRSFGAVRYARVVLDPATEKSKGTGFVCFIHSEDADSCLQNAPYLTQSKDQAQNGPSTSSRQYSLLENTAQDSSGLYTIHGRVLQLSRAVDRKEAARLTCAGNELRDTRERDKRRLYLLSEGTIPSDGALYGMLSAAELKVREDSATQRQSLIRSNPSLHLSLTRLSIRNLPRSTTSKDLKALAREAVVGFASDVKSGLRTQLSKEELSRGGHEAKEAEKERKAKGKGIVKQAKVVYESRDGAKVAEQSGAGRSRRYGFIEYSSHRWALMGLRWLNGHHVDLSKSSAADLGAKERTNRLIAEFAIENAQVVSRRCEKEAKARERSKYVSERRENGENVGSASKALSRNHLMARTRKRVMSNNPRQTKSAKTPLATADSKKAPDKVNRRQQIIGRKRMLRRSRNKSSG